DLEEENKDESDESDADLEEENKDESDESDADLEEENKDESDESNADLEEENKEESDESDADLEEEEKENINHSTFKATTQNVKSYRGVAKKEKTNIRTEPSTKVPVLKSVPIGTILNYKSY